MAESLLRLPVSIHYALSFFLSLSITTYCMSLLHSPSIVPFPPHFDLLSRGFDGSQRSHVNNVRERLALINQWKKRYLIQME